MKHGIRPSVKQKKLMIAHGLDYAEWLVLHNLPDRLVLVHRDDAKKTYTIEKGCKNELY